MKKLLGLIAVLSMFAVFTPQTSQAQSHDSYLGALDTLTNADTTTYEVTITGNKHCISFQTNVTKISGTVAGTINVYGSVDGTNYITTAIATAITITDASQVRSFTFSNNAYKKYKLQIITSGTQSCSQRGGAQSCGANPGKPGDFR
jgi:hypothetical protein